MASLSVCMVDPRPEATAKLVPETLPPPEATEQFLEAARKLLGCEWIEFVQFDNGLLLLVDEIGASPDGWTFRGQSIRGRGIFLGVTETDEGCEETDCPLPLADLEQEITFGAL